MKTFATIKKKCLLLLIICLASTSAFAQYEEASVNSISKPAFFGVGLSINDYGLGFTVEKPILSKLSIFGNAGIGSWGAKLGAGVMYYSKPSQYGSSYSIGLCHATGVDEVEVDLEVEPYENNEKVKLKLNPTNAINIMYHYNLKVGNKSKFVFSTGYGFVLSSDNYDVTSGERLTQVSKDVMEILEPGGFIFGVKFAW